MRYILISLMIVNLFAVESSKEKIKAQANKLYISDEKNIVEFIGDVKLDMGQDSLKAGKLIITMKLIKNKKKPVLFVATKDVELVAKTKTNSYICKGDKIVFKPEDNIYEIIGNGYVYNKTEQKELFGETIYIDMIKGEARIVGNKNNPVKFIMNMDSK